MTPNEQSFVRACLASALGEENQAQWDHYHKLTDPAEKTAYAETVVEKWNRILGGSELEPERKAGQLPPGWHKMIPRGTKEADPTGRSSKDPGAKLDAGKVRMGLVLGGFANALMEVSKVGTNGAAKYSDNGWKQVPNAEARYTDALLRHVFKHMRGEVIDPEWGLHHLAHAAWGCLAVLEKMLERQKADQTLPEGTTFENGFAMVPNENPLRFKLNPESLPPGTTVTVTRPIGGSPEQAAPLKEFTPLPTETALWVTTVEKMDDTQKRYQILAANGDLSGVLVTCRDRATQGAKPVEFHVSTMSLAEQRTSVEDFVRVMQNTALLSDLDIAVFTGFAVMKEGGTRYELKG